MAKIPKWFAGAAVLATLSLSAAAVGDEGKAVGERERGERASTVDKVPAPVRATAARETRGRQIGEIVPALQNGMTVYFVQYVVEGMRQTILLASDGKVIYRKSEDEEDD
jgi:hypothetical protein